MKTLILTLFVIKLGSCDFADDKYAYNYGENVLDTTNYERARNSVDFTGKVVLVTGSNSGIGAETVRLLSYLGAQVVVTGRNLTRIRDVGRQCWLLSPYKLRPLEVMADLTDSNQVIQLYNQTITAFNRLDLLVNNAGIALYSRVMDSNFSMAYSNLTQVDDIASIQLTQLFIPHLNRTNGSIIFTETEIINHPVSVFSLIAKLLDEPNFIRSHIKDGFDFGLIQAWSSLIICIFRDKTILNSIKSVGLGSYAIAKSALIGLRQTLSIELGPYIRVNSIRVGIIENTNILRYFDGLIPAILAGYSTRAMHTALGRNGQPIDIAYAVVILASPLAQFITGQYIRVDGGYYTTL